MNKEKRNIQPHANKEVKHLMVLLDKSQASEFKKMVPELQDTWIKKQMFRTETEMRFSVLSDNKYGTRSTGNQFVNKILTLKILCTYLLNIERMMSRLKN